MNTPHQLAMAEDAPETEEGLAEAQHGAMRWNTPLSEAHAELLLSRLELPMSGSILDLGCGWGELLIRAVAATGDAAVTGIGVSVFRPASRPNSRSLRSSTGVKVGVQSQLTSAGDL